MQFNLPKLIGHRGIKDIAPENTLDSIICAINCNLRWVEVDVKISKDKIPFLLHDDNLNRTTTGTGSPINLNYKEINQLNAGIWFNKKFINCHPPTLKEVFNICIKENIGINIELKPNKNFEKDNVIAIVNLIKKTNFKLKYYFSSFDLNSLIHIRKLLPYSFVGILIDKLNNIDEFINILQKCKKYNFFSCGLNKKIITDQLILYCKKYELHISSFSNKNFSLKESQRLWSSGVDTIFIDNPTEYKKILNSN